MEGETHMDENIDSVTVVEIEKVTDLVYKRLEDLQVYLDYDFLREMVLFCICSASTIAAIRGKFLEGIDLSFLSSNPYTKPFLGEIVTLTISIPLIVTILAMQYTTKRNEGLYIASLARRLHTGRITQKDRLVIKACYNRVRSKSRKLSQKDLEKVLSHLSEGQEF